MPPYVRNQDEAELGPSTRRISLALVGNCDVCWESLSSSRSGSPGDISTRKQVFVTLGTTGSFFVPAIPEERGAEFDGSRPPLRCFELQADVESHGASPVEIDLKSWLPRVFPLSGLPKPSRTLGPFAQDESGVSDRRRVLGVSGAVPAHAAVLFWSLSIHDVWVVRSANR